MGCSDSKPVKKEKKAKPAPPKKAESIPEPEPAKPPTPKEEPPPKPDPKPETPKKIRKKKDVPENVAPQPQDSVTFGYVPYQVRKQPFTEGWDPTKKSDQINEKDLSKGKGLLYLLETKDHRKLALFNATDDKQMVVNMKFEVSKMVVSTEACEKMGCAPATLQDNGSFQMKLYPGQTVPFVEGEGEHSFRGDFSLSYKCDAVDRSYIEKNITPSLSGKIEDIKKFYEDAGFDTDAIPKSTDPKYDYDKMEKVAEAVAAKGGFFVDLSFPPKESSLGLKDTKAWMTPSDYLPSGLVPKLFVGDGHGSKAIEAGDIDQGLLPNCWVMASVAALTEFADQLIIPMFRDSEQETSTNAYHVRLAVNGWYHWQLVDGYLPVQPVNHPAGPCFAKNKQQPNELWVSILEKAYAKAHGSYQSLYWGDPRDALHDLTGYPSRKIELQTEEDQLFKLLHYHDSNEHLMYLATMDSSKGGSDKCEQMGLTLGHVYTLIGVYEWNKADGTKVNLCKIRCPWGEQKEWLGSYSDTDPVWMDTDEDSKKLQAQRDQNQDDDGTFWMDLKDVREYFNSCGATYTNTNWWSVRLQTQLKNCAPKHVIELTPTSDMDLLVWATQHYRRGLHEDDERAHWAPLRISVIRKDKSDPEEWETVMQSPGYQYAYTLIAHESEGDFDGYFRMQKGETYYAMVECCKGEKRESARNKDIVLALMTSSACNMRILNPDDSNLAEALPYENLYGLKFDDAKDVSNSVNVQINKSNRTDEVNWSNLSEYGVKPVGKAVSRRRAMKAAFAVSALTGGAKH